MKHFDIVIAVVALLLGFGSTTAQELDGHYYPFGASREWLPEVDVDSTLFYVPVEEDESLFDRLTRYGLSSVRFARRGDTGATTDLDGVAIDASDEYRLVRLLGAGARSDGMAFAPHSLGGFAAHRSLSMTAPYGQRRTSAMISATDRNKLLTIRLYDSRPLGDQWSYALSLSGEGGRDMRVGGLFTQRVEAALTLSHRWNDGSLSAVAMVAPSQRGVRSASSAEAFALTGDNLYNPSWGIWNGKERNSRVRRELVPSVAVSLRHKGWFATVYGRAGRSSISGLNWYDARIPTPDNYRQLPSFFDSEQVRDEVERVWRERDPRYTQINWEELYARNLMTDGRSVYVVEDRTEAPRELRGAVGGEFAVARNTVVQVVAVAEHTSTEYYKRMRDLLGGDYIIDIDQYLIDDERFATALQNDLRNPNRRVGQGDKFGYDYRLNHTRFGARAVLRYHDNRKSFDAGAEVASVGSWRTGLFEKQIFAGAASIGESQRVRSVEARAKARFVYSFSARHRLSLAAAATREQQPIEQLLLQPAYNNALAEVDPSRTRVEGEVGYSFRSTAIELNVKGFARVEWGDDATMRFFDDVTYTYADAVVSGIDRLSVGAEVSGSVILSPRFSLEVAATAGSYRYTSNPSVSLFADVDNGLIVSNALSYMSGLHTATTPTFASVARICYAVPYGWRVEAEAAFAAGRYAVPTPVRRMSRVTDLAASPEEFKAMTTQQRLRNALTISLSAMRSWTIGGVASRLTTIVSVRNLLNDRSIVYSAYEPSRVLRSGSGVNIHYRPMPERYTYAYPLSFNVSISYRFR